MKRSLFAALVTLCACALALCGTPETFNRYFEDATLRVDYVHMGDAQEEWIAIDRLVRTDTWGGSLVNLVDPFNNGKYFIKVYAGDSDELIYSRGFNSIFGEYITTGPALKGIKGAYHETALIPAPKAPVKFVVERRIRDNSLVPIFEQIIDPANVNIVQGAQPNDVDIVRLAGEGDPHTSMDLVIVPDGYTASEKDEAIEDARYFAELLLDQAPFSNYADRINITCTFRASQDSGPSMPTRGIYHRTAAGSSFNALDLPRYMLTEDNRNFRDIACTVPHDIAIIMVNSDRYGGGGIFNFFCTFTAKNSRRDYLLIHEFGHAFAGLADEYYSSNVSYEEFYPRGIEPVEPNITALLDPENIKWKDLVTPGTKLPTDWGKTDYDNANRTYQEERRKLDDKIARLTREEADPAEIDAVKKKAAALSKENADRYNRLFTESPLTDVVGAFEGAGYMSEGFYRPQLDCIMFSTGLKPYCKVCERAVEQRLKWYLDQD